MPQTLPDFLRAASPQTLPSFFSTAVRSFCCASCPQHRRKLCLTSCSQHRCKLYLTSCPQHSAHSVLLARSKDAKLPSFLFTSLPQTFVALFLVYSIAANGALLLVHSTSCPQPCPELCLSSCPQDRRKEGCLPSCPQHRRSLCLTSCEALLVHSIAAKFISCPQ